MTNGDSKLQFDKELLAVYITGLQAEVEEKLRAVTRFRTNMQRLDEAGVRVSRERREEAARALIKQVDTMLQSNREVREILTDIKTVAEAVLADIEEGQR
jgi:hypothetical protein